MKAYKLEIKALIFYVSAICIFLFSTVLMAFKVADKNKLVDLLWDYGTIVTPITFLWLFFEKRLWRTRFMQNFKTFLNIPPDLRGRWEGKILSSRNADQSRKFVIEVEQTLTTLSVHSYSEYGNSTSILSEIGSDEKEEIFSLCFLWEGEIHKHAEGIPTIQRFNGYTILNYDKPLKTKEISGTYFTDLLPEQTHGTIDLKWVSWKLEKHF